MHGTYTIVVSDKSGIHNFHLVGPGLNKTTSVAKTGVTTWKVTLKKGTYKYRLRSPRGDHEGRLQGHVATCRAEPLSS